jgi:hypothetical protein
MGHVAQQTPRITNDLVVGLALDVAYKSDTARVLFIFRVVQSLRSGETGVYGIRVGENVFKTIGRVGGEWKGEIAS